MAEGSSAAAGAAATGAPAAGEGQAAQTAQAVAGEAQSTQVAPDQTGQPQADGQESATEKKTEQVDVEKNVEGVEKRPPHKFHDKLSKFYPDRTFESEQDYDKGYDDYVDFHEEYYKRGTETNEQFINFLDAEPKAAAVIKDAMKNGVPFATALARHFGPDDFTIAEGDDGYSDYAKNIESRNADLKARRESDAQFETNMKESDNVVLEFAKEEKLEEAQTKEMLDTFNEMMQEVFTGKISKKTLQAIKRSVQFDEAVSEAAEIAGLEGKNATIKAEMDKDAEPKGDGIPTPDRSGEVKDAEAKPSHKIDGIVNGYNERNVYED